MRIKVQWTEFNQIAYRLALETYPEANPKDFEHTYEGNVIDKYHTFWGTPKFVVVKPNGEITTVTMTDCRVLETEA